MLSIIIPAQNEPYLLFTVADILAKSSGAVEVIVLLDGWWPNPDVINAPVLNGEKTVRLVHWWPDRGMRSAINAGARIAKGDYLMKCDAHCAFSPGFDEAMTALPLDTDVMVPVRYELDANTWDRKVNKKKEFQYIERGTCKGRDWPEYAKRFHASDHILLLMTMQGSCWCMRKDNFKPLDAENFGGMGREAQEISINTWLSGGRVLLNRNCWYAHWNKPKEFVIKRRGKDKKKSTAHAAALWNDETLKPIIDKFAPVPTW